MKVTRRQLAAALAVATLPLPASPQAAEDLDAAARDRVKSTAAALNAVPLPMSTEPAVAFRVL
ncbi:MAG TPA: hypothetical protein VNV86_08180 [Candidatus Acidoferrum sp.]|jgi:hypothetical protein|nr:hypothetical protein [Candidatus Acidoferrum sp.]